MRDHLTARAKKGDATAIADLNKHPCPPVFAGVLALFGGMSDWRGSSGMGPSPLTLSDVREYEDRFLGGVRLSRRYLEVIKRLDYATLATD